MPLLHDAGVRSGLETRIRSVGADAKPLWGRMSVDQMFWHVSQALAVGAGQLELPPEKAPMPRALIKFFVLYVPWPKNGPTNPNFVARTSHDFEAERARCLRLMKAVVDRPLDAPGTSHPLFGPMSSREISTLHAKHLDHHLRQFGA